MKKILSLIIVSALIFTLSSCTKLTGKKYHLTGEGSKFYYAQDYIVFKNEKDVVTFYFNKSEVVTYDYKVKGKVVSLDIESNGEFVDAMTIEKDELVVTLESLNETIKSNLSSSATADIFKSSNEAHFIITRKAIKNGLSELS